MKCLVLLAALASSALAAVTVTCPQPPTKKDFELKRYLGKWLEAKIIRRPFERGACGTAEYTLDSSQATPTVLVLNNQYVQSAGQYQPVQLTATPADPSDSGSAKFTVNLGGKTGPTADYWVIDTDYDNFAVVYSCASSFPSVTMWILRREGAAADYLTKAMTAIDVASLTLYNDALETVEHNCPPTTCPATGPMSCEKHMSNLDASKMAGRWWEIQHSLYASLSDQQSCSYADFSATSTGIQIISNSLSTLDSSKELQTTIKAVWANPQDTGLFNITEGLATKGGSFFCVLDTDYDNYAVVSACGASASGSQDGSTTPTAAREGGVYVWSRKQRLESDYQLKANKALTTAGILATTMQMSLDSPCSKDALKPTPAGAATATASFLGVAMTLVLAALSSQ